MTGFSHVVATRNGLFLVNPQAYRKVAEGSFFGLTLRGSDLFCFEAGDNPWAPQKLGRIVRFALEDDMVSAPTVLVEGLDNGCHQVDFIGAAAFVVDTYNQKILEFDRDWRLVAEHAPLPPARIDTGNPDYAHINSIFSAGASIYLMLHYNGLRPSEILEVDRAFRERRRIVLAGECCHDIVMLEDGALLVCDSAHGGLINDRGFVMNVDAQLTRGLSVSSEEIVVGSSLFGEREHRLLIPGFVTFMDRDYRRTGRLHIAASPTQIRRIDGRDLSLSNRAFEA